MKLLTRLFFLFFLFANSADAQTIYDSVNILKVEGKLNGTEQLIFNTEVIYPAIDSLTSNKDLSSCACWLTRDATWQIGQFNGSGASGGPGVAPDYRNDDWTTPLIILPFNFCFYGTTYSNFYLNNNGNISFGAPYSTFTATGFPDPSYVMVAPFWGDVDTRDLASGLVYYKVTPTALMVQWENVGYYGMHADLRNTFQLIITDGTDPLIPGGNNVSFCYKDMQWTTGDASGGAGGFGGFPATVGANKGDGVNYIQFGTFDQPGAAYDGPTGSNDGIDWLDNQSLFFNTCAASNISPIANGLAYCDTMQMCAGDVLNFDILFMSPEAGQTTTVTATSTMPNFVINTNTPGNNVSFNADLTALLTDIGFNTVTFTATDDGTPSATTTITVVIEVVPTPVANAGNDTSMCAGPVQLTATGGTLYTWTPTTGLSNANIANPIASPLVTTTYIVEVSNGTCSDFDTVIVTPGTPVTLSPDTTFCIGESYNLLATGGLSYSWSPSTGLSSVTIANPIASPVSTTTYTVTATDAGGCLGFASVTITVVPPVSYSPFGIVPDAPYYAGDTIFCIDSTATANSWIWYFGDGTTALVRDTFHLYPIPGIYTICHEITLTGQCTDTSCRTIEILPYDIIIPNVITPNGDGINDLLIFPYLEYYPNSALVIFNRWGNEIYSTANYLNDWNGKDYSDGVYYYILHQNNLEQRVVKGFFHLFKKK